ncbi:MAG: helix-turn-helix transcriptional regulator [Hyphomicrobiaceae bacterium]|nr:helix-turn-helix transcriptional regulator [Hyphomicrobiaceae bacterium]
MKHERKNNAIADCPLTAALAAIGGKWKLVIVYALADSALHFAAIQRRLRGISHKVLAQQLGQLIADGIISREETGEVPSPVVYSLTDYGHSLEPLLEQLLVWGRAHLTRQHSDNPQAKANGDTPSIMRNG